MLSKTDPKLQPQDTQRKTALLMGDAGLVLDEVATALIGAGYHAVFCGAATQGKRIRETSDIACLDADLTLQADRCRLSAFLDEHASVLDVVIDCLGYPQSAAAACGQEVVIFGTAKGECERWAAGIETVLPRLSDGAHVVSIVRSVARYKSGYFRPVQEAKSNVPAALVHGAVLAATRQMALEHAGRGLRFNAVVAGLLEHDQDWVALDETERRYVLEQISAGRPGTAAEVAATALFLASTDSNYLTGEAIDVNGGWWMS